MENEDRRHLLEAVADAAREYRMAMTRYLQDQTRLLNEGASLEEVARSNWGAFETKRSRISHPVFVQ